MAGSYGGPGEAPARLAHFRSVLSQWLLMERRETAGTGQGAPFLCPCRRNLGGARSHPLAHCDQHPHSEPGPLHTEAPDELRPQGAPAPSTPIEREIQRGLARERSLRRARGLVAGTGRDVHVARVRPQDEAGHESSSPHNGQHLASFCAVTSQDTPRHGGRAHRLAELRMRRDIHLQRAREDAQRAREDTHRRAAAEDAMGPGASEGPTLERLIVVQRSCRHPHGSAVFPEGTMLSVRAARVIVLEPPPMRRGVECRRCTTWLGLRVSCCLHVTGLSILTV
ncbi:uncharacterized protein LOC142930464 [Petromyzon marinus]|uniref:uncharacterized protein LOC142930464 n=1 Tax=Petromyzon marinus TaxID=7757 RepID=UPI003F703B7D